MKKKNSFVCLFAGITRRGCNFNKTRLHPIPRQWRRPGLDDFVWDNAERGENGKIKRSTRFMSASRELYFERKLRIFPELLKPT